MAAWCIATRSELRAVESDELLPAYRSHKRYYGKSRRVNSGHGCHGSKSVRPLGGPRPSRAVLDYS
jgi:hypothetical protein